jgi:hypothetical protein
MAYVRKYIKIDLQRKESGEVRDPGHKCLDNNEGDFIGKDRGRVSLLNVDQEGRCDQTNELLG